MTDPVTVPVTATTWTKVATNVTSGYVHLVGNLTTQVFHTYRDTGGVAPAFDPRVAVTDALPFNGHGARISNGTGIDVYIYAMDACTVRVAE